jgi:hypothetical protein
MSAITGIQATSVTPVTSNNKGDSNSTALLIQGLKQ